MGQKSDVDHGYDLELLIGVPQSYVVGRIDLTLIRQNQVR